MMTDRAVHDDEYRQARAEWYGVVGTGEAAEWSGAPLRQADTTTDYVIEVERPSFGLLYLLRRLGLTLTGGAAAVGLAIWLGGALSSVIEEGRITATPVQLVVGPLAALYYVASGSWAGERALFTHTERKNLEKSWRRRA